MPNAVGVDIGCGMIAARTQYAADDVTRDDLQALRIAVHQRVPVGQTSHKIARFLPEALLDAADRAFVVRGLLDKASVQVGTLGSGNHFIEIQRDEDGAVWVMLHSGSRNIGLQVCNHYHKIAKRIMSDRDVALPDLDLAYLPDGEDEYEKYLADMRWCMAFAEANRAAMFGAVCEAMTEVFGAEPIADVKFDTHHNFAEVEDHFGERVLVHRKGGVRAEGLVTIPGSMGTASYIAEGLKPSESFNTCSHGAGRKLGRKEANRVIDHAQAVESMQHVVYGIREGEYDEMPGCYKDIEDVMRQQADLARPVHRLLPMAVVKG